MNPQSARAFCRSPNRFSPALLLYQHFVLSYHGTHYQRFSSSAPAPEQTNSERPLNPPRAVESPPAEPATPLDLPARPKIRFTRSGLLPRDAEPVRGQEKPQKPKRPAGGLRSARGNDGDDGSTFRNEQRAIASERHAQEAMFKARLASDARQEYAGELLRPYMASRFVPESQYPWAVTYCQGPQEDMDGMARLNREMKKFYDYATPTRSETFARKNLVEQLRADLRAPLEGYVLEVFGSERTQLSLALSDIDLRLVKREYLTSNTTPPPQERGLLLKRLYKLRYQVFKGKDSVVSAKYASPMMTNARYPLVSVTDRGTGLEVQIVSTNDTQEQRGFMNRYLKEYPYLRQTYVVIRTMLEQRGLTDVFAGGFGSYTLFMMLVASLQNQPNQRGDAAGALLNFLYYWAYFKTSERGVSIEPPGYCDKMQGPLNNKGESEPSAPYLLSLRDPADAQNDLGRRGRSILHLQATLRYLTAQMIVNLNANSRPSLLAPIVGEVYARNLARREKLAAHGGWVERHIKSSLGKQSSTSQVQQPPPTPNEQGDTASPAAAEESDIHSFLATETETEKPTEAEHAGANTPDLDTTPAAASTWSEETAKPTSNSIRYVHTTKSVRYKNRG